MPRTIHVANKDEFDKHINAKGSFGQAAGVGEQSVMENETLHELGS